MISKPAITEPDLSGRHESTRHMMRTLRPNPALDGIAMDVAMIAWNAGCDLVTVLRDGPELSAGLRLLRQAKDCLVIQGLLDSGAITGTGSANTTRLAAPGELYPAPARAYRCGAARCPTREPEISMTALLDRVPMAEIDAAARQVSFSRLLLNVIVGIFFVIGWTAGRAWLALVFCAVAIRLGWREGTGAAARAQASRPPAPAQGRA